MTIIDNEVIGISLHIFSNSIIDRLVCLIYYYIVHKPIYIKINMKSLYLFGLLCAMLCQPEIKYISVQRTHRVVQIM